MCLQPSGSPRFRTRVGSGAPGPGGLSVAKERGPRALSSAFASRFPVGGLLGRPSSPRGWESQRESRRPRGKRVGTINRLANKGTVFKQWLHGQWHNFCCLTFGLRRTKVPRGSYNYILSASVLSLQSLVWTTQNQSLVISYRGKPRASFLSVTCAG